MLGLGGLVFVSGAEPAAPTLGILGGVCALTGSPFARAGASHRDLDALLGALKGLQGVWRLDLEPAEPDDPEAV